MEQSIKFCRSISNIKNVIAIIFILLSFGIIKPSECFSQDKQVFRFNISVGGYPPFTIVNVNTVPSGIMVEVLDKIATKMNWQPKYQEIPRKRVDSMILGDDLDGSGRAIEWTSEPSKFIFSEPIVETFDSIIVRHNNLIDYQGDAKVLINKTYCGQEGYNYKVLDELVAKKQLKRIDGPNPAAVLKMVKTGRCQFAIINNLVALHINQSEPWSDELIFSGKPIEKVFYRLMLSRKFEKDLPAIDQEISRLKSTGEMKKIIERYTGIKSRR